MRTSLSGLRSAPMLRFLSAVLLLLSGAAHAAEDWWNKEWLLRKKLTLDTTPAGSGTSAATGPVTVLVRLHEANYQLSQAGEGGANMRFLAADGKTVLPHYVEKFDADVFPKGSVWVKLPEAPPNGKTDFWLYYGNLGPNGTSTSDAKGALDDATVLAWHCSDDGAVPVDSTGNGNNAAGTVTPAVDSFIGDGITLSPSAGLTIAQSPTLAWTAGGSMTWSAWVKPAALQPGVIISRGGQFKVGLADGGVPYVTLGTARAAGSAPLTAGSWHHLAVTVGGGNVTLFLNGMQTAVAPGVLPALDAPYEVSKVTGAEAGFSGDLDEMLIANVARSADWLKLAATTQTEEKAISAGADEQGEARWIDSNDVSAVLIRSLTVDGWIAIIILAIMSVISLWIMAAKMRTVSRNAKGNELFMERWKHVARDLTVLDNADDKQLRTLGGKLEPEDMKKMKNSSVFKVYHVGAEEVRHRVQADESEGRTGLSERSMLAIRASMEGTMVRESQRLNSLVVLLTICISGGPFIGLLGTVIGVMITFAAIAAAGDVNVTAIAPGIAGALLATVAGLAVAIPALFGYNYIVSKIKETLTDIQVFIDEFVTRMAEYYPENQG